MHTYHPRYFFLCGIISTSLICALRVTRAYLPSRFVSSLTGTGAGVIDLAPSFTVQKVQFNSFHSDVSSSLRFLSACECTSVRASGKYTEVCVCMCILCIYISERILLVWVNKRCVALYLCMGGKKLLRLASFSFIGVLSRWRLVQCNLDIFICEGASVCNCIIAEGI